MELITIASFPFKGRTIKEIINAGKKYEILETNHGHSYEILMNQDITDVNEHEKSLMAFIKFLEEEIKLCIDDDEVDSLTSEREEEITNFISLILNRITNMVSKLNQDGERPTPYDVRACLGQKSHYGDIYLYDIIELIMNSQGYMHIPGTFDKIQKKEQTPIDLPKELENKIRELNSEPNARLQLNTNDK